MAFPWNISRKLAVLTLVMLAILVANSAFGVLGLRHMHAGFQSVSQDTTKALINLSGTVDALHRIRIRVMTAAVEPDPAKRAAIKEEFGKQLSDLDRTWGAYFTSAMTAEEAQIAKSVDAGIKSYTGYLAKEWDLIAAGKQGQVQADIVGPAGTDQFRAAGTPLRTLLDYQQREAAAVFARGESAYNLDQSISFGLVGFGIVLGGVLSLLIGRSISNPLHQVVGVMERLARGDTSVEVAGQQRKDEVGEIARSVAVFKQNLVDKNRMEGEAAEARQRAERQRRADLQVLAGDFESQVGHVVQGVAGASSSLERTAQAMSSLSDQVSSRAGAAAAASEQASANVHAVAVATEELSGSVTEIGRQVTESARIARSAVDEAAQSNVIVRGLAEAASRIDEVLKLIDDIASQTNLLALNATIEAARAGEAGKGFAIVASEVKNLASQTAKATGEIAQQINSVQTETDKAVSAIQHVGETIRHIDEITAAIASAVEQQSAATQEIARNVEQAARGTKEVSSNIAGVTAAAGEARQAAVSVLDSGRKLSSESGALSRVVGDFVVKVRG